ncbi:hypothetical protein K9N68_01945 [Kovacikia minuta CCNUW1]|uniref:hypothetical protein n=1 Tax=Kovacikia minuta TaxID=2931930 RepID=UPI001CCDD980|nr:hypothetical protein [Kovacikia minuta]UBF26780.1 hypothetical protein K9N68_01945 [Kovacikia minuta CCNUW1]
MEEKAMCSNHQESEARAERELWSALLHAEGASCTWSGQEELTEEMFSVEENPSAKVSYPWNPADPEAEKFFTELEQGFSLDDWSADEVASRSSNFFSQVNQLWSAATLQDSLSQRFAARIPQELLGTIVQRAQQALASSRSLADQLVQSVQELLPNLAEEDLQVLARPLAYAMRNGESHRAVEATLEKVRPVSWEELSEIEQARLSLAIARSALTELEGKDKG